MKYYSAIKKSETIEFVKKKKWINLESIILTQSQEEKKACLDSFESWTVMYVHVHMCHDVACVCV